LRFAPAEPGGRVLGMAGECSEASGPTRTIRGRLNKRNRNRPVCVSAGCPQGLFLIVVVPVSCSTAGRRASGGGQSGRNLVSASSIVSSSRPVNPEQGPGMPASRGIVGLGVVSYPQTLWRESLAIQYLSLSYHDRGRMIS